MKQKCMHVIITGNVQGVGYRSWLKREAEKVSVTGWVKNREDGAVEAVIQGEEKKLRDLIQKVKRGPDVGWVEDMVIEERPVDTALAVFEVIY